MYTPYLKPASRRTGAPYLGPKKEKEIKRVSLWTKKCLSKVDKEVSLICGIFNPQKVQSSPQKESSGRILRKFKVLKEFKVVLLERVCVIQFANPITTRVGFKVFVLSVSMEG